jgi:hypothetical protein
MNIAADNGSGDIGPRLFTYFIKKRVQPCIESICMKSTISIQWENTYINEMAEIL